MTKPVVNFLGKAEFFNYYKPDEEGTLKVDMVASVRATNHYVWGYDRVRTSVVQEIFDDGSFETMNTMYVPYKEV